ncbi:MAG: hypothetical protein LC740_07510 [Actinobacteria bacterium]|nr:hypothetical protein [Actinomycetota bacterium]
MARRMTIRGDEAEITVELDEGPVAKELWDRLPMKTNARLRGEEIHFPVLIPAATEAPDRAEVETGDVAYWPPEDALCLFFGDTPARTGKDSPVASVGRIVAGIEDCKLVRQNETLKIEAS